MKGDEGKDTGRNILILAFLVDAIDKEIAKTQPLAILQPIWEEGVACHMKTRGLISDWYNAKMNAAQAQVAMKAIVTKLDGLALKAEALLSATYGADQGTMAAWRDEAIAPLRGVFGN